MQARTGRQGVDHHHKLCLSSLRLTPQISRQGDELRAHTARLTGHLVYSTLGYIGHYGGSHARVAFARRGSHVPLHAALPAAYVSPVPLHHSIIPTWLPRERAQALRIT